MRQVPTIANSVMLALIRNTLKIITQRSLDVHANLDRLKICKCK